MSDMDDWTAAQWLDESARIEATLRALEEAERAGTPKDCITLLAYEAGVGELYRNNTNRS